MTAKEFLQQGWRLEMRIRAAEDKLQGMRARAGRVKSSAPRAVPGGGGRARAWTDAIDALCDAEAQLCREIAALYRLEAEIGAAIDGVSDLRLRVLLKYRYQCYMTWAQIAEMMDYDVRTVTRLHGIALRAVKCP